MWPPKLTLSEWADRYRVLPPTAPEPGPWRTDRTPFARGPMDAVTDPSIREIVLWGPTQSAKTEILLNAIGYAIHYEPGPALLVYPVEDTAREFSVSRLEPMIRSTPALATAAAVGTARDHRKSLLSKTFPGMTLELRGCNSPSSLASRSCRYVLIDELDRCPIDVGGEGSAADLARQRSQTFWNAKLLLASTCTVRGESQIEHEYETSDQRKYYVPCLACGYMHVMAFENIDFGHEKDPERARVAARYRCPQCKHEHADTDKPAMLARGEWRADKPGGTKAGFWWSALYSPWVSFGTLAAEYRSSFRDRSRYKVFVNCRLAQTWVDEVDAPEVELLKACMDEERHSGSVPSDALVLTAGVDVQKDRLYYVVRAWGLNQRSWLIRHGCLPRDLDRSLSMLDEVRLANYGGFQIACMFIDSGYEPDFVYQYCLNAHPRNCFPSKGTKSNQAVSVSKLDRDSHGKPLAWGLDLYLVASSHWKGVVHDHIRVQRGDPGEWRLPCDVNEDYLRQVLAEARVERQVRGVTVRDWVIKDKDAGNHYLDCEAYAAAAAWFPVRVQRATAKPESQPAPEAKPQRPPVASGRQPTRRSY